MNAHVSQNGSNGHCFGKLLTDFCEEENLVVSDAKLLPPDSYTFLSDAYGTTSWLDHVIATSNSHSLIRDMKVCYDKISSDHHPLHATIDLDQMHIDPSEKAQA